jgi:hypothetical protein
MPENVGYLPECEFSPKVKFLNIKKAGFTGYCAYFCPVDFNPAILVIS